MVPSASKVSVNFHKLTHVLAIHIRMKCMCLRSVVK